MTEVNRSIRLQGRTAGGLTGISGTSGEIFYDNTNQTLRLFNGATKGGSLIANRAWVTSYLDWANIQNKPIIPTFSAVAASGNYSDLIGRPVIFSGSYLDLADKPTATPTASTSVLGLVKVDGTTITILNGVISSAGSAGTTINSINDISDVDTLTTPPTNGQVLVWNSAGSQWKPGSFNSATVGLGNVTNESKLTMFNNPSFTGTVSLGSGVVNLPVGSTIGGSAVATTGLITFSGSTISTGASSITVSKTTNFSSNITVSGIIGASINALSDVDTASVPPVTGQVLKWTGTLWAPGNDASAVGAGTDADSLGGQLPSYYLDYSNFANKPDLSSYAPKADPALSGIVTISNSTTYTQSAPTGWASAVVTVSTIELTFPLSVEVQTWCENIVANGPVTFGANANSQTLTAISATYVATDDGVYIIGISDTSAVIGTGITDITFSIAMGGDLTLGGTLQAVDATFTGTTTFSGTVAGITATTVGLGNVTNESKATMFAGPTFTGTVSGITAAMVSLGNVTNESKATMFASPTFTGTVSGVSKSAVGLGSVENTALSTWTGSTSVVTVGTLTSSLRVNNTGGLGYASGQGGAVTQTGNRTTAVSLNKLSGTIQLFATTAAAGTFSFTVNNTLVAANDVIVVNTKSTSVGAGVYIPQATQVGANSFRISVYVPTAISSSDTVVLNFVVLKGTAV
jgi:hypothetical protein